ncbi:hypothetical protein ABZP36_014641 [Zizania latifolia]
MNHKSHHAKPLGNQLVLGPRGKKLLGILIQSEVSMLQKQAPASTRPITNSPVACQVPKQTGKLKDVSLFARTDVRFPSPQTRTLDDQIVHGSAHHFNGSHSK